MLGSPQSLMILGFGDFSLIKFTPRIQLLIERYISDESLLVVPVPDGFLTPLLT